MLKKITILIPTAGYATRMRPQTWSKPKPLVSVAGRTVLDHLLGMFHSVPGEAEIEYVIITSPGLGETQIPAYMQDQYPQLSVHYVVQPVMRGQSDALWLARQHLDGPMIVCFSDTLIDADFSFLAKDPVEGVAWVKPVEDPRRFGVAETDAAGWVTRLVEKPKSVDNKLVVVGCYFFREAGDLLNAIQAQIESGASLKGEYFLTEAVNILLQRGMKMRTQTVDTWLDTGTIDATLETNRALLAQGCANRTVPETKDSVEIIPPVFIHPQAEISDSIIGPHVSIGADCRINRAHVQDSILEAGAIVEQASLKGCFIGRQARVQGRSADDIPMTLNIGDNSCVMLK